MKQFRFYLPFFFVLNLKNNMKIISLATIIEKITYRNIVEFVLFHKLLNVIRFLFREPVTKEVTLQGDKPPPGFFSSTVGQP